MSDMEQDIRDNAASAGIADDPIQEEMAGYMRYQEDAEQKSNQDENADEAVILSEEELTEEEMAAEIERAFQIQFSKHMKLMLIYAVIAIPVFAIGLHLTDVDSEAVGLFGIFLMFSALVAGFLAILNFCKGLNCKIFKSYEKAYIVMVIINCILVIIGLMIYFTKFFARY